MWRQLRGESSDQSGIGSSCPSGIGSSCPSGIGSSCPSGIGSSVVGSGRGGAVCAELPGGGASLRRWEAAVEQRVDELGQLRLEPRCGGAVDPVAVALEISGCDELVELLLVDERARCQPSSLPSNSRATASRRPAGRQVLPLRSASASTWRTPPAPGSESPAGSPALPRAMRSASRKPTPNTLVSSYGRAATTRWASSPYWRWIPSPDTRIRAARGADASGGRRAIRPRTRPPRPRVESQPGALKAPRGRGRSPRALPPRRNARAARPRVWVQRGGPGRGRRRGHRHRTGAAERLRDLDLATEAGVVLPAADHVGAFALLEVVQGPDEDDLFTIAVHGLDDGPARGLVRVARAPDRDLRVELHRRTTLLARVGGRRAPRLTHRQLETLAADELVRGNDQRLHGREPEPREPVAG